MSSPPRPLTVTVTLMADLRRYLPDGVDGPFGMTLPDGASVGDLLRTIGIPSDTELTIGIDGELGRPDSRLEAGADVLLVSPMEGGEAP
jgi:hypothetical protein